MKLLQSSIAQDVISHGLSMGADFVEVFIEKTQNEGIVFKNSQAEDIQSGVVFGIGIRLIHGEQALYGYTNSSERGELLRITTLLGARIGSQNNPVSPINFERLIYPKVPTLYDKEVNAKHKLAFLKNIDEKLRQDAKVSQVMLNFSRKKQIIEVYNSEGVVATEERPYIRLFHQVVMRDGSLQTEAVNGPGAIGGWEFMEKLDSDEICANLLKQANTTLYAKPCPAGKMPVVIDNGFGGLYFMRPVDTYLKQLLFRKRPVSFGIKWVRKLLTARSMP